MNLYAIRRPSGWRTAEQLEAAAARSTAVGDNEMSHDVRYHDEPEGLIRATTTVTKTPT